ncbi:hypothetical protein ACFQ88_23975 [Paenibacillus sp. NPDC056579]|uniref:hypothetical protein n=1 Tax=Paenibacillus sp. NPDC056579 TaxID=3345871 RepID=UPI00367CE9B8
MVDDLVMALSSQLKEIGMEIIPKGVELAVFPDELQTDFTLALEMTYGISWDPYTTISNMTTEPLKDLKLAQALAFVDDGSELIRKLNVMSNDEEIQETYSFILNEIHDQAIFIPISYTREPVVFNNKKIKEYAFNSSPAYIEVAEISLI